MTDRLPDDAVAGASLLVAYVSEDDALDHVRDAALELGARSGAKVILYDRDFPFFTTSYGRSFQRPSKISFAFCKAE